MSRIVPVAAAILCAAGTLMCAATPAGAVSVERTFAGQESRAGFTVEMQTTITVPASVSASAGAQVSAWVMDTSDINATSPSLFDQVGWIWESSTGTPRLFAEYGTSLGAHVTAWHPWIGPRLVPGSTITVALDCAPWLGLAATWYVAAGRWQPAGPPVDAAGLCVPGTWWGRMTEIDANPGTSVVYTPVTFSATSEIHDWYGRRLADVGPVAAISPGA